MVYHILTPHQSQLVEHAQKNTEIIDWYYLTGGTALSECYIQHRLSEDIDFFTRSQVNDAKTDEFIAEFKKSSDVTGVQKEKISGLFMYKLTFPDGDTLKIDFNEYDFPQIEPFTKLKNLKVDSLFDITINKLYTILSRSKARDFVDLYFLLQEVGCRIEDVLKRIPDKFPVTSIDDLPLANQLAAVVDVTDYPQMLVPFNKEEMIEFYLKEAKKLEPKIFK